MELHIRNSFYRDWDNINSREINHAIEVIVRRVKRVHYISQIPHSKKLIKFIARYKIEVRIQNKIYWVFCVIRNNKIEFVRIKSEDWFKKNL